jgi:hypothetical protein
MNALTPLPRNLHLFLDRDTWWRRAGYAVMHAELLYGDEISLIAGSLHTMQPSDDDAERIDRVFIRTLRLVRGVRL